MITAEKMLEKATAQLLFSEPFYASLLLRTPRVAVGPEVCEYMAVDGKSLFYNAENIVKLSFDVIKTLLMHEAAHLAYAHHVRMVGKDPELSNIAADHVVNLILKQGAYKPWDGWFCDSRFEGQTFERVYGTIAQERQQQQGGGKKPQPNPPGGLQPGQKPGTGKPVHQHRQFTKDGNILLGHHHVLANSAPSRKERQE